MKPLETEDYSVDPIPHSSPNLSRWSHSSKNQLISLTPDRVFWRGRGCPTSPEEESIGRRFDHPDSCRKETF